MHVNVIVFAKQNVQPLCVGDLLVDGNNYLFGLLEESLITPVGVHL